MSGGIGMISSCVTVTAPWRKAVPMQSEPVSPPPITTTYLPSAWIGSAPFCVSPRDAAVLLRQVVHGEMDAAQVATLDREVARLLRAAGQHDRVVLVEQRLAGLGDADMGVVVER